MSIVNDLDKALNAVNRALDAVMDNTASQQQLSSALASAAQALAKGQEAVDFYASVPEGMRRYPESSLTVYALVKLKYNDLKYAYDTLVYEASLRGVAEVVVSKQLPSVINRQIRQYLGGGRRPCTCSPDVSDCPRCRK